MKFSLRTLLIAAMIGPPIIAGFVFVPVQTMAGIVIPLVTIWIIHLMAKNTPGAFR